MIEEIIYTSAEKGLKAGSRGFCTVVSTAGMAINTAERLESMSGYRHAFPMQDPKAALNPVNYSHVTLRMGGKNAHVISRVADAGQDYSGRTNKLAHHLMFDDVSRMTAGPARLMAEKGVLVSQWDGNVKTVPARNLPTPAIPQSIELKAWKQVTGDSGWAGWVAEQLTKDKAPVSVIFQPGTDTLLLVREVLDLLPVTQQWSITFCTYFTKLLAGTECQLRFVLHDTPDATALRNDARAKAVDLTARLPECSGGALVQAARAGHIQAARLSETLPIASPTVSRAPATVRSEDRQIATRPAAEIPAIPKAASPDIALTNAVDRRIPSLRTFDTIRAPQKRSRAQLYSVLALTMALIIILGVGLAIHTNRAATPDATAKTSPPKTVSPTATSLEPVATPSNKEMQDGTPPPATDAAGAGALARIDSGSALPKTMAKTGRGSDQNELSSGKPIPAEPTIAPTESPNKRPALLEANPFEWVHGNMQSQYPNHPELRLFELPSDSDTTQKPTMKLVLQEGDRVTLAFHASFHHAINSPDRLNTDYDIRLSEKRSQQSPRIWTAELLQAGESVGNYGEYSLMEDPGIEGAFLLQFHAGALCKSSNPTDRSLSHLFRFCPLVVSVQSRGHDAWKTEVFAQRRGRILKAEGTSGTRSSEFESPNEFALLHLFRNRNPDETTRLFSLQLEVRSRSTDGTLAKNRLPFEGRLAKGVLFTSVVLAEGDNNFTTSAATVDSEGGYIEHSVNFMMSPDELNNNAPFQFKVSKAIEARLKLPWMPRKNSQDKHPGEVSDLLLECDTNLEDKLWGQSLKAKLDETRFRLPVNSKQNEVIIDNWNSFNQLMTAATSKLVDRDKMLDMAILEAGKKGEKESMDEIKQINEKKVEVQFRRDLLSELQITYSKDVHDTQAKAYLAFREFDERRALGYEVAIRLAETKLDGIVHPETSVYLIESDFAGEQP